MNLEIKNPNQKPKTHLVFYGGATGLTGFIFSLKDCHHEAIEPWNEIVIEYKSCITFNTRAKSNADQTTNKQNGRSAVTLHPQVSQYFVSS